ncbi:MAG: hypothetical protein ACRDJH_17845 [Thermomicrobiales bacterium]
MAGSRLSIIGGALLVAVALVVGLSRFASDDDEDPLVVRGTIGSEKIGFLEDPAVRQILAERYGLRVEFSTAGSLEMMQTDPGDRDFLWPASPIGDELHFGPASSSEEIFYSPIVFGSWAPVTNALVNAGLVERIGGTYYITDLSRFIRMIEGGAEWSEIGLTQLPGRMTITTTDPATSNSGSSFAGLLANTLNDGNVVTEATVDDVIGQIQAYYAPLGLLVQQSGELFRQYVEQGMSAYPLIVGYEGSLIEFTLDNRGPIDQTHGEIRLLYSRPAVWSSHPMVALTPSGEQLLSAVQDVELRRIAWERHGFRSGLFTAESVPEALEIAGVPPIVDSVMPLPRAAVMERIIRTLHPADVGTPRPAASPTRTSSRRWRRPQPGYSPRLTRS